MAETKEKPKNAKSEAYFKYEKLIETYKKQNPTKYKLKKDVLAERLAKLA